MAHVALFTVWYWECRCGWFCKSWTDLGVRGGIANHLAFQCSHPRRSVTLWPDPVRRIWAFNVRSTRDREDMEMLEDLAVTFE